MSSSTVPRIARSHVLLVIVIVADCALWAPGRAEAATNPGYCGVYAVYAAARLEGRTPEFASLLQERFVGSLAGSTLGELKLAAESVGLHALPVESMTVRDLLVCPYPVILHTKSSSEATRFDHWQLFTGIELGMGKFLDPDHGTMHVDLGTLSANWDGAALVCSGAPIDDRFLTSRQLRNSLAIAALACVIGGGYLAQAFRAAQPQAVSSVVRKSVVGAIGLIAVSSGVAAVYHRTALDGLFSNSTAVRAIQDANMFTFAAKADLREVKSRLLDKRTLIVDARLPQDYQKGHIPGAINIPVALPSERYKELLGATPQGGGVIVYCQNEKCPYAKKVAARLRAHGYAPIAIFKGGWSEWSKQNQ